MHSVSEIPASTSCYIRDIHAICTLLVTRRTYEGVSLHSSEAAATARRNGKLDQVCLQ